VSLNQFRHLKPGEHLPGLPTQPWNKFLDALHQRQGIRSAGGMDTSPTYFLVKNTTGSGVPRFGVLKVHEPLTLQTADSAAFKNQDVLKGTTPAAADLFVITQEPIAAGMTGWARLIGLTKAFVAVGTAGHRFAAPTTATNKLTSQAGVGPAYIIHPTSGTGDLWCTVVLSGQVATKATHILFTLPGALAVTDATKASCTVNDYWGGSDPGATVTLHNMPASTNYVFSGASGNKGMATYDDGADRYVIQQMECP
jgi:hypothetical protein